jgi:hypothetical protein
MKKAGIWLVHVGYWSLFGLLLLTLFFFAVYVPAHAQLTTPPAKGLFFWSRLMAGFALVPGLLSFYASYIILFNRFLAQRRFFAFLLASGLVAVPAAMAGAAVASLPVLFGPAFLFGDGYSSALSILLLMTALAWINGLIGSVIKAGLTWYHDIRLKEELHRKNVEIELALVKSQIEPHFLFNTLNNIDVLITRDAAAASAYLNKLSGIMRFLLYETRDDRIGLDQEITYLQQYIDLQKLRTSNADYVSLEVVGQLSNKTIAPMLLLPFIENAFKHTESRKASSQITIRLLLSPENIVFTCANTLIPAVQKSENSGLGNTLIRKRLALLYPDSHVLVFTKSAQSYQVQLELRI